MWCLSPSTHKIHIDKFAAADQDGIARRPSRFSDEPELCQRLPQSALLVLRNKQKTTLYRQLFKYMYMWHPNNRQSLNQPEQRWGIWGSAEGTHEEHQLLEQLQSSWTQSTTLYLAAYITHNATSGYGAITGSFLWSHKRLLTSFSNMQ